MTITITEKEYEAICEVINQVEDAYEAATDETYLKEMAEILHLANNVALKYKKARAKASEFQYWRSIVSRQYRSRNLTSRRIDQLTRDLMKRFKEER